MCATDSRDGISSMMTYMVAQNREQGKDFLALLQGFHFGKTLYSEFQNFSDLVAFSFTGASLTTF